MKRILSSSTLREQTWPTPPPLSSDEKGYAEWRAGTWSVRSDAATVTDPPSGCRQVYAYLYRRYRAALRNQPGFSVPGPITRTDHVPPSPPTGTTLCTVSSGQALDARVAVVSDAVASRVWRIVVARAVFDAVALYGCEYVTAHGCSPPPVPLCVRLDGGGAASCRAVVVAVDSPGLSVTLDHAARLVWVAVHASLSADVALYLAYAATRAILHAPSTGNVEWILPAVLTTATGGPRDVLSTVDVRPSESLAPVATVAYTSLVVSTDLAVEDNPPSDTLAFDEGDWEVHVTVEGREARISRGTADPRVVLDILAVVQRLPSITTERNVVVCRGAHRIHVLAPLGAADAATARWSRGTASDSVVCVGRIGREHVAQLKRLLVSLIERRVASHPVERAGGEVRAHTKRQMAAPSDSKEEDRVRLLVGLLCGHPPVTNALAHVRPLVDKDTAVDKFTFPFVRLAAPDAETVEAVHEACVACLARLESDGAPSQLREPTPDGRRFVCAVADRMTVLATRRPEAAAADTSVVERCAHRLLDMCTHRLRDIAERYPWVRPVLPARMAVDEDAAPRAASAQKRARPNKPVAGKDEDASVPVSVSTDDVRRRGVGSFDVDAFLRRPEPLQLEILHWMRLSVHVDDEIVHAAVTEMLFRPGTTVLTAECPERVLMLREGDADPSVSDDVRNVYFQGHEPWEVAPLLHMVFYHPSFQPFETIRAAVRSILVDCRRDAYESRRTLVASLVGVLERMARLGRVRFLDAHGSERDHRGVASFLKLVCTMRPENQRVAIASIPTPDVVDNLLRSRSAPPPPKLRSAFIDAEYVPDANEWERVWNTRTPAQRMLAFVYGPEKAGRNRVPTVLEAIQDAVLGASRNTGADARPEQQWSRTVLSCALLGVAYTHRSTEDPGETLARDNLEYARFERFQRSFATQRHSVPLLLAPSSPAREAHLGAIQIHLSGAPQTPPSSLVAGQAPPQPVPMPVMPAASRASNPPTATVAVPVRSPLVELQWGRVKTLVVSLGGTWLMDVLEEARRAYVPSAQADVLLGIVCERVELAATGLVAEATVVDEDRRALRAACMAACGLASLRAGRVPAPPLPSAMDHADAVVDAVSARRQTLEAGPALFRAQTTHVYLRVDKGKAATNADRHAVVRLESCAGALDAMNALAARYEQEPTRAALLAMYVWLALRVDHWWETQGSSACDWPGWKQMAHVGAPQWVDRLDDVSLGPPDLLAGEYTAVALYIGAAWTSPPGEAECARLASNGEAAEGLACALAYAMPLVARVVRAGRTLPMTQLPDMAAYLLHPSVDLWLGGSRRPARKAVTATPVTTIVEFFT